MNNTEENFIEILSAFVNERKPEISEDCDAKALYELSKAQSVAGIVSFVLHKYGREDILSHDQRLESAYDKTITQLIRKDFEAQHIFKLLNDAEIPHITFKGMVVKDCYPVPELRTFGDIDVIIKSEDRAKSHEMMMDLGYKPEAMDGGAVYGYKKDREFYELHTTLNSERTKLSDFMSDYWSRTELKSGFTYEFEKNFHLSYLISHIEKHVNCSSAGVRLYLDIALYIKKYKEQLDLSEVREILKECKLEKFFDTVLYLCHRWFQTEVLFNEKLTEEQFDAFCLFTLRGGTFGNTQKTVGADSEIRRSMNSKGKINKTKIILAHIFPYYREVRRMYPFFDGKPYLLPFGWVVHWFKAAKRSGLKNIKRVAHADVTQAQAEKKLLEQIGSSR